MGTIGQYTRKLLLELSLAVQKQAGIFAERLKPFEQSGVPATDDQPIGSETNIPPGNSGSQAGGPPRHWIELVRHHASELLQPAQPYDTRSTFSRSVCFQSAAQNFSEMRANELATENPADDKGHSGFNETSFAGGNATESETVFYHDAARRINDPPTRHDPDGPLSGSEELSEKTNIPEDKTAPLQQAGSVNRISTATVQTDAEAADKNSFAPAEEDKTPLRPRLFLRTPIKDQNASASRQKTVQDTDSFLMQKRITIRPPSSAGTYSRAERQSIAPLPPQEADANTMRKRPPAEIKNHTAVSSAYITEKRAQGSVAAKSSSQKEQNPDETPWEHTSRFSGDDAPAPGPKRGEFSSTASGRINTVETLEQEDHGIFIKHPPSAEFTVVQNTVQQKQDPLHAPPWPALSGNQDDEQAAAPEVMEPWPALPEDPVKPPPSVYREQLCRFEDDWREINRRQRIDAEQKGVSWNALHF